jgi:Uncharacterised conserved protein (DUF2228)
MSRSQEKHQAKLQEIYGVDFPDALFWLHEFILEQQNCEDPIDLNDLAFTPGGVLKLLLDFDNLNLVEFTSNPLLHYRYYRDVPEFFTCLTGDSDGQHWGMLLDEPNEGFRGVAMYWSNDGAEMTVYESIFDALIVESQDSIESYEDYLLDEDDEDGYYQEQIEIYEKLINRIEEFLAKYQLSRNEGRPIGLETSTGLDLVLNKNFGRDRKDAIEMLKLGRELWYWEGKDRSTEAYDLMRKAYELLDRPELIRILDVHYRDRSLPSVDLVRH